ncbi:MAG: 4-hydroxy-tetrahydrodipicolinate reductase [Candidatus Eisenbacteria sp.]|nr:4-hydroxy-tetrahydrodipicolinate reductase [Candidatus Eisenbacteria bacterium]
MIKVVVCGACGRLGSTVCDVVSEQSDMTLAAGVEVQGHGEVGGRVHEAEVVDDLTKVVGSIDVAVDFTHPKAAAAHATICAEHGKAIVIGTTGLGDEEVKVVKKAAEKVPVVLSPNMSVGVNMLFRLADQLGRTIPDGFDVEIIEAHHKMKKDAPSGTAVKLGKILAEARGIKETIYGREGMIGERPESQLAIHTIRGGDIVGEHTLLFIGDGERFEVTHRAHSRRTFAAGVPHAVRFLVKAKAGLYDMIDVLGLRD